MKILLAAALASNLAACGGGSSGDNTPAPPQTPPAVVTISDPLTYLAQSLSPNGDSSTPLHDSDAMTYRRTDFGGYQIEDSFLRPDGTAITTFEYPPFGPFVAADEAGCPGQPCHGQGGEQYAFDGTSVRITSTQDGGKAGVQTFPGPDGWVVFRTDATADKQCIVAQLGSAQSYTCYVRQNVAFPGIGSVDTIVSEHWSASDPGKATAMERFFLGRGWGRVVWQAWNAGALPIQHDIAQRCPDFGFNAPPAAGWVLNDCREVVNVVPADGSLTGAQLWHP